MTTRDWKFLVWKSTATSLSTALVDFTIDNAHLTEAPYITGSRIQPLDGRTEARPWTINVLDSSSFLTSQIGDSAGRLDILNRFVQARVSVDGSTYQPVAGGRLIDAVNADNIATWQLTVQDEWIGASDALLFTTNTTLLYPPKPLHGYKGAGEGRAAIGSAQRISSGVRRYWYVTMQPGGAGCPPLTDEAVSFIRGDLKPNTVGMTTAGSFTNLRFRYAGTDYKVFGFGNAGVGVQFARPDPENRLFNADALSEHQRKGGPLSFWVAASSTSFGGTGSKTFTLSDAISLHAMGAPASVATPLHIWPGWSSANPWGTVHPMQVLKDILGGVYSSSSEATPYYSTESFTGTADVRLLPTVGTAFRITQPAKLRDWVTEHLLVPHGIAAFGDSRGKVAFKSIMLPDGQLGYSTANLYSFTSTNLRTPHPDWRTTRREQVTQIQLEYERISNSVDPGALVPGYGNAVYTPQGFTLGGDGLSARFDTTNFNHDRIQRMGTFPVRVSFHGYGVVGDYSPNQAFPEWVSAMQYYQGEFVKKVFFRYGDGPIRGTLSAMPNASTIAPGDFVRLTLGSFPNPSSGGYRGGTRLVQVLTKDITPEGYAYEYLDAGAAAAKPTTPTLSLSTSTANPKHALRVTVSAGVPSGGGVFLYMAESATTSPPSSTSAAWHPVYTTSLQFGVVSATGTYVLPRLKNNTRYFVKGQAGAGGPRSAYSTPVTKITAAITSPTALTMTSVKAKTAGATWTVGDLNYPLVVHVDSSTSATPTTANQLFRVLPGTNRTLLANLTPSQKYRSWVRHADPYGGYSGFDSTTFTMTSTATTSNSRKAPALGGMYLVFGST